MAADGFSRRNQKAVLHLLAEIAEHGVRYKIHTLGQAQVDNLRTHKPSNGPVFRNVNIAPAFRNGNTASAVVTWEMLKNSTARDEVLDKVIKQALKGFPVSKHQLHRDVQPYHNYRHQLAITEGVLLYKSRVVIPMELREQILQTLHAAHQGISGMTGRAEQAVFWPGITQDIRRKHDMCKACMRNAPSQPAGPPVRPPSPEYPFQLIVGDYFHKAGLNYLVIADRYSGWVSMFPTGSGDFDADALIRHLRTYFITFGVPTEYSSDDGPQFQSGKLAKFFKTWGVYHRKSSAHFPHSNSRAELAVKTAKRILMENTEANGELNLDAYCRATLQYRNTPLQDVRLSPAQIIYGRQIKDFIPVLAGKYRPRQEWGFVQEDRDRALARRLEMDGSRLERNTRQLKEIPVGTAVSIQNQTGRHKTKWDKTGIVVENQPFNKVLVRVDGSRRVTTRNRRFVRVILPPLRQGAVKEDVQLPNHSLGDDDEDGDDGYDDQYHHVQQQGHQDPPAVVDRQEPQLDEDVIPQPTPQAQEPPNQGVDEVLQRDRLPGVPHLPQAGLGDPQPQDARPRRDTRPPVRYSSTDYDLSTLNVMIWEAWTKLQDLPSRNA